MKYVVAFFLAALLLLGLPACESRTGNRADDVSQDEPEAVTEPETEPEEPEPEPDPTEGSGEGEGDAAGAELAVRELLDALQTSERTRIQPYADYDDLLKIAQGDSDANKRAILRRLRYSILDVQAGAEDATVKTTITSVDMNAVLSAYLQSAMALEYENALSEEPMTADDMEREYELLFIETLADTPPVERTVDIRLLHSGEKWQVQVDDALRNAVLGDFFAASQQISQGFAG